MIWIQQPPITPHIYIKTSPSDFTQSIGSRMQTDCWKCKGTGKNLIKTGLQKCNVCINGHIHCTVKKHRPYRPFNSAYIPTGRRAKYDMFDSLIAPSSLEMLTSLCGHFCIYQQEHGHRMTSDDVSTAAIAILAFNNPSRHLDLGTGLGSVLNIVNWYHNCESVGVEAQEVNYNLACKTVEFNGIGEKCKLIHADFRDLGDIGVFDLITGTPPYFPLANGSHCVDTSRSMCAFEHRGGVEEYCLTASKYLTDKGHFIMANTSIEVNRTLTAGIVAGLQVIAIWYMHGIEGKQALYCIFEFVRTNTMPVDCKISHMNIRNIDGQFSREHEEMMQIVGKPSSIHETGTIPKS